MAAKSLTSLLSTTFNPESLGSARMPLSQFAKETKALTDDDKRWFARQFIKEGYAESVEIKIGEAAEVISK